MRGFDELFMSDLAIDDASIRLEGNSVFISLGPVTSRYVSLETKFERVLYRGLMEGFGIMRPLPNVEGEP